MHPPAPVRDRVSRSEKRIIDLYRETGSISKSIIAMYKGTIIKNFILMAICQGCLCMLSVLMYLIIKDATGIIDNEERTIKLGIYFGSLCICQIVGSFLKNYIYCDLSRLSVRLKCGVIFTVYRKLMRISVLNPSEHTEGNILNYINVDAQKLEDAITKLSLLMEAIWLIIFGFTVCIWLISFNIIACIISFFALTFFTMYLYKVIFKYEVMVAIAKDKRTQLLKNVINNVKYIKTRVWENFYHSKIFFSRNAELDAINKSNFIFVVIVGLAWINPTTSYLSTYASMLLFGYKFDPATILAYVRIFASILKGMGYIPTVVQFFIELGVSLDRINVYLDTTELDGNWINRQDALDTTADEDTLSGREKQPFAIEMDLGNFYWNKMDEKIMKNRRERSRKKRVKIRKLNNVGTAGNDQNLLANAGNQSVRSVSVMNSVRTMGTNVTGSSLLSKNSAAPTLT